MTPSPRLTKMVRSEHMCPGIGAAFAKHSVVALVKRLTADVASNLLRTRLWALMSLTWAALP
jgi:hypothetical protein